MIVNKVIENEPMGKFNWRLFIFGIILLILIIAGLSACTTAEKLTYKAISKDKAKVAEITRAEFPCTTTKADTVISTKDSLIWIECPEQQPDPGPQYLIDTIHFTTTKVLPGRTIRVPVTLPVKTVTIVQKVEDSAKIYVLQAATLKLQADNDKLSVKVANRNKALKWLVIALLISAGLNFIQFKLNGLPKIKR